MVSSLRRQARRLHLGANPKASAVRWWGQWIVRIQVCRRLTTTRHVLLSTSCERAEKSCPTRRRLRGLRKGKCRSRVCQTRRTTRPARQPQPPSISSRKVNHQGRKFLWAVMALNRLRKAYWKYRKLSALTSVDTWTGEHGASRCPGFGRALKLWWNDLSVKARLMGIPYQAAFHGSWDDFTKIEGPPTARANAASAETLELIMTGLPRRDESPRTLEELFDGIGLVEHSSGTTDRVGNSMRTEPTPVCKRCRGLGATPGPGYPNGCSRCYKSPVLGNTGRGRNHAKKGGRRYRRP